MSTCYHCTSAKNLNAHDGNKLKHDLGCLWKKRFLPLVISIDDDGDFCIYLDRAYQVHQDGKGHSGLHLTMGTRQMMIVSKKLVLATMSSPETEIVSIGERFPRCVWFSHFFIAQGEDPREDMLIQDNKNAILMHKNYTCSIGK